MLCLRRLATPFYKKLAYTDMLTGIGNRTAFELELKDLEKKLPRSLTIVAYDLNYMKQLNDTYGHAAGDAYLRRQLFPAGRLDKTSTGFVLLTDDGTFAHDILAPKRHSPRPTPWCWTRR